jgi:hypothetical protein
VVFGKLSVSNLLRQASNGAAMRKNPSLACALEAGAKIIVSRDEDLLALGKPFGIEIITPRQLLANLAGIFDDQKLRQSARLAYSRDDVRHAHGRYLRACRHC